MDLKNYIQDHKSEFDDLKMSSRGDENFKDRLKKDLHQPKKGKLIYLKYVSIAASIVLVISMVFWFNSYQENNEKKTELLSNLENDSTGKRLEAVYEFSDEYQKEDEEIINVLIKTLLYDENTNVKIATIDALLQFPQNEKIRKSLILALSNEKTPLVQMKLINSMSILREQRAKKPLEEIIKDDKTYDIVKNKATIAMADLKQ